MALQPGTRVEETVFCAKGKRRDIKSQLREMKAN